MHEYPSKGATWLAGAFVAALVAVLVAMDLTAGHAAVTTTRQQTVVSESVKGLTSSCKVDSGSSCTIVHNLGVKPTGVTATVGGRGQLVAEDQASRNATSIRLWFNWRDGTAFALGTLIYYSVTLTYPADVTPTPTSSPPTTTTSSPPVSTPPASTPPASTPPPSPTPTGTVSPVKTCTNGTTIPEGSGVTFSNYFVHNNNWNDAYGGSHTIVACNYDNWYLTTSIPSHSDGAVEAYPNVHRDYSDVPVTQIQSANFAMKTPAVCTGCVYDVAFDIWIGSGLNNELMIWTDNKAQTPGGTKQATAVTFGGVTYDVWHSSGYTAYVARVTQKYGTMPLQSFFNDMKAKGWAPSTATTWQVDYGVETVTTGGTSQRFDLTDFSIADGTTAAAAATKNETVAKQHLHALGLDRRR